jgi:hypothetical protein
MTAVQNNQFIGGTAIFQRFGDSGNAKFITDFFRGIITKYEMKFAFWNYAMPGKVENNGISAIALIQHLLKLV